MVGGNHFQANEIRIWGPPGCGKTTRLTRQEIPNAIEAYGPNSVLVTSFTKAAASELVSRRLPLHKDCIGTLHSHCYRALDHPTIAEGQIALWNKEHPEFRLSPQSADVEEISVEPEFPTRTYGDELYAKLHIRRAHMEPMELWPADVCRFAAAWTESKRAHGFMDYSNLLEAGLHDFERAPGNPKVIVVDEVQDLSRLQLAVVRQWARHAEQLIMAGDDDQAILTFAGADPEALREPGYEYARHELSQSNRIPRAIHAFTEPWIQQLSRREPKTYRPRDAEGEVRQCFRGNYRCPDGIVNDAERYLEEGKTIMFLASCSYMIQPLKAVLYQRGLPFHNPYRTKESGWNPLAHGNKTCLPVDRLLAFLQPRPELAGLSWRPSDLRAWVPWLASEGVLADGAGQLLKQTKGAMPVHENILAQVFRPEALIRLLHAVTKAPLADCVGCWLDFVHPKHRRTAAYLAEVALRRGDMPPIPAPQALISPPQIIIGTGHSVKGGEADVVYLFPDLSPSGARQWEGSRKPREALIRLAYVMATRAKQSLILCEPARPGYLPLDSFLTKTRRAVSAA
jgi:ATP-dependent DNA helicase UvrD/PcrA